MVCPLYLLFYMGDAFLTSYYAHYFIENGMSPDQQSALLGVIPLALFLGCFVLSPFAKSPKKALWLYRICLFCEIGLAITFTFVHSFAGLMVVTFLIGFFDGAPFSFLEGYVVPLCEKRGIRYSNIRIFGTIGYIVSLAFGYFLLSNFPVRDSYYFAAGLFALAAISSFFLNGKEGEVQTEKEKGRIADLLSAGVIILLLSQLFSYGAFNSISYILPVYLKTLGLADADYSLMRSISIVAEMIMLLLMPVIVKKRNIGKWPLLVSGVVCLLGSSLGVFITHTFALGYLTLILSAVGKAFCFAFLASAMEKYSGENTLAMALTVNTGLTDLTSAALNFASSAIYANIGFQAYFGIACGLEAIGVILLFFLPKEGISKTREAI